MLRRPHRLHRLGAAAGITEGDAAPSIAAEIQSLPIHQQPPVLPHPLDRERAGLPAGALQLAFQRHLQSRLGLSHASADQCPNFCGQRRGQRGGQQLAGVDHGLAAEDYLHRDQMPGGVTAGLPRFNNPRGAQVPLYSARVLVSLRPSVLDPAGEATRAAAGRLGVDGISRLRIGKAVEVELEAPDAQTARQQLELLSDRLLANPVIENWTLELKDDSSQGA